MARRRGTSRRRPSSPPTGEVRVRRAARPRPRARVRAPLHASHGGQCEPRASRPRRLLPRRIGPSSSTVGHAKRSRRLRDGRPRAGSGRRALVGRERAWPHSADDAAWRRVGDPSRANRAARRRSRGTRQRCERKRRARQARRRRFLNERIDPKSVHLYQQCRPRRRRRPPRRRRRGRLLSVADAARRRRRRRRRPRPGGLSGDDVERPEASPPRAPRSPRRARGGGALRPASTARRGPTSSHRSTRRPPPGAAAAAVRAAAPVSSGAAADRGARPAGHLRRAPAFPGCIGADPGPEGLRLVLGVRSDRGAARPALASRTCRTSRSRRSGSSRASRRPERLRRRLRRQHAPLPSGPRHGERRLPRRTRTSPSTVACTGRCADGSAPTTYYAAAGSQDPGTKEEAIGRDPGAGAGVCRLLRRLAPCTTREAVRAHRRLASGRWSHDQGARRRRASRRARTPPHPAAAGRRRPAPPCGSRSSAGATTAARSIGSCRTRPGRRPGASHPGWGEGGTSPRRGEQECGIEQRVDALLAK